MVIYRIMLENLVAKNAEKTEVKTAEIDLNKIDLNKVIALIEEQKCWKEYQ